VTVQKSWQPRRERVSVLAMVAKNPGIVSDRLREIRATHGDAHGDMPQEEAARRVKVGVRTWQRWEAGESVPYPRNIEAIAHAFDVSVEEFFEGATQTQLDRIEDKLDEILLRLPPPGKIPSGAITPPSGRR
jgi:transcriptional regulator with XRE-family HTH domain